MYRSLMKKNAAVKILRSENFKKSTVKQRYTEEIRDERPYRISDDGNMGVSRWGGKFQRIIFVRPTVPVADAVLKLKHTYDNGDLVYGINVSYIQDCGAYANKLLQIIHQFDSDTEQFKRPVKNTIDNTLVVPMNPAGIYRETLASQAVPGIGEAFMSVSNPKDPRAGKEHFNFHWGVVIAESGSDVITAEADSKASDMWFQMYSHAKLGQSFQDHYMNKDQLAKEAKTFTVGFDKSKKTVTKPTEIIDLDSE